MIKQNCETEDLPQIMVIMGRIKELDCAIVPEVRAMMIFQQKESGLSVLEQQTAQGTKVVQMPLI